MPTYVALLRGIMPANPNTRNEKLIAAFTKLGFKNVRAVIGSGNIIFEGKGTNGALEKAIESGLSAQLQFSNPAIVRSEEELRALAKRDPFHGHDEAPDARQHVTFLKSGTAKKPAATAHKAHTIVAVAKQEICSIVNPTAVKTVDVMAWLEKQFGKQITTRTWKTVHRILEKMNA